MATGKVVQSLVDRAAKHGLTPLELCRECGLHHSIMYRWINGETSPTLRTIEFVAAYLDKLDAKAKAKRAAKKAAKVAA